MTDLPARPALRVSKLRLIERVVSAICLAYGCTVDEVETVRATNGYGPNICLASVRAGPDAREVIRLGSIQELYDLLACKISSEFLAKSVSRSCV